MTVLLLLLMAYELIGSGPHEWIGLAMFVLFVCHHLLNRGWYKNLFRGSYTPMRLLQTILAGLVLLTMLGSMISSVLISREVFAFLPISGGRSLGRTLHLLCAYWGFVLLSLHLGIHWRSMMAMAGRLCKPSPTRRRVLQVAGALAALYGLYAFFHRSIPTYLFLQSQFVFSILRSRSFSSFWTTWPRWACLSGSATSLPKRCWRCKSAPHNNSLSLDFRYPYKKGCAFFKAHPFFTIERGMGENLPPFPLHFFTKLWGKGEERTVAA